MLPNNLIGQTSNEKLIEIYDYISNNYKDIGNILEFGTFLGKVTYALSLISKEKNIRNKIFTYDIFIWNKLHKKKFPNINLDIGSSFLEKSKLIVSNDSVNFVKGDIDQFVYEDRSPIEVVILDAPKNFKEIKIIFEKINNNLIPGVSKIIFMDFFLPTKYDTIVFLYLLKKYGKIKFSKFENVFFELEHKINLNDLEFKNIFKIEFDLIKKFVLSIESEKSKNKLQLPLILLNYELCGFLSAVYNIMINKNLIKLRNYVLTGSILKRYYMIFPIIIIKIIFDFLKSNFRLRK